MNKRDNLLPTTLKALFKGLPINVVYLYGSMSSGQGDKLSDYDFGILFSQKTSGKRRFDLRLSLFGEIGKLLDLSEDQIDVVDAEAVPTLLQFNIISGKVIYCANEGRRVFFETRVLANYHDEHYYLDAELKNTLEKIGKGAYFERSLPYP